MVEGVQAHLVALVDHPPHQIRVARGHRARDEEHAVRVVLLELVEDLGRPLRVGTVVEGQDEFAVGNLQRLGRGRAARVDDGTALEYPVRHLAGGVRGTYAVVREYLAVHIAAQHQHREKGDEEQ